MVCSGTAKSTKRDEANMDKRDTIYRLARGLTNYNAASPFGQRVDAGDLDSNLVRHIALHQTLVPLLGSRCASRTMQAGRQTWGAS